MAEENNGKKGWRQLAVDHWLKILVPFIVMWAAFVTKGALTGSNLAELKATVARQNEVHHKLRVRTEDELKIYINNRILDLKGDINDRNDEVRQLRNLIMDLWRIQGEMERECGKK